MTRKFLIAAASAAVFATSFIAAPAQADRDHLFNFVAGATALVILSEALNDHAHPRHAHPRRHVHKPSRRPTHFHGQFRHRHNHARPHGHRARHGGYWQR